MSFTGCVYCQTEIDPEVGDCEVVDCPGNAPAKGPMQRKAGKSRRKIVTLSGSSRFIEWMAIAAFEEEKAGRLALSCHLLPPRYIDPEGHRVQSDHQAEAEGVDESLDALHLDKIEMSDELLVIDVQGYIGASTAREIAFAQDLGIPVRYLSTENPEWFERCGGSRHGMVGPGGDFSCSMCKWREADCRCPVELNR